MSRFDIDTQVLILVSETREISRLVITNDSSDHYILRRLTCPFTAGRPCSLDCAMIGGTEEHGGVTLIWCRGSGSRILLGVPDPERTDFDELRALTSASAWLEQVEARRNGSQG